jgi:hypothetical protein
MASSFTLALAFCASTRNGYGIYRLNSTDFVFLASINGLPAVTADKTGWRRQNANAADTVPEHE